MTLPDSQRCVLLTLGRLPVALDLARGFHALGWRVIVAEPFRMHLARMSNSVDLCVRVRAPKDDHQGYLHDLEALVARENIDLIVPVSEETPHVAALHERFDTTSVFSAQQSDVLRLHDKLSFNRLAADLELTVPQSCQATDSDAARVTGQAFVAKPRMSCSGRGVRMYAGGATDTFTSDYLLQQKIEGTEFSSFSVARAGQTLITVVYRSRASSGSVAVVFERVEQQTAIERWISTFIEHTGHTGFISFDFIVDHHGVPYALECNPRATSGIHFTQPLSLAKAIAGTDSSITLRPDVLLQEGYSSYTALLGALGKPAERSERWRLLRDAKDVTWSKRDPWPFVLMSVNSYPLIGRAVWQRKTFAEVAALDIEWSQRD